MVPSSERRFRSAERLPDGGDGLVADGHAPVSQGAGGLAEAVDLVGGEAEGAVEDWVEELDLTPEQDECMRGVVADFTDDELDTIQSDSDELDGVNMTNPDALANASEPTQRFYAGIALAF